MRKINNEDDQNIRRDYKNGIPVTELIKIYGISQTTIYRHINKVVRNIPIVLQKDKGVSAFWDRVGAENVNKGKSYKTYLEDEKRRQLN